MDVPSKFELYDDDRFQRSIQMYLDRCSESLCTTDFLQNTLPNILTTIANGKSQMNIIGVGSGTGNFDLEMLSQLSLMHPGVLLDNDVVEPSSNELHKFRESLARTSQLDHVKFTWNQMTASEFEEQWRQRNIPKKGGLHPYASCMCQFISTVALPLTQASLLHRCYVEDPAATIGFFLSLLNKNGKLLITQASRESAVIRVSKTVSSQLSQRGYFPFRSSADIRGLLDERGVTYQSYKLQAVLDVTECFIEGDENGELLLDILAFVQDFSKKASSELKEEVLRLLQDPEYTVEKEGRILVNSCFEALVLDASN